MAVNTSPIFTNIGDIVWAQVTTADTTTDGTGANVVLVFTSDATDGSYIQQLRFTPRSTSGSTSTSLAVARIYINNGSTPGTATNNILYGELALPVATVNTAATAAVATPSFPLALMLPPSYRIYVGVTVMAANTNWAVCAQGGDY